jgi:hypothetical protein
MTTNRAVIASIALRAGAVALAPSTASATAPSRARDRWFASRLGARSMPGQGSNPQTRHRTETTGRQIIDACPYADVAGIPAPESAIRTTPTSRRASGGGRCTFSGSPADRICPIRHLTIRQVR